MVESALGWLAAFWVWLWGPNLARWSPQILAVTYVVLAILWEMYGRPWLRRFREWRRLRAINRAVYLEERDAKARADAKSFWSDGGL